MLARHRGYEVVATDILPEAIGLSRRYARAQGLDGRGADRVCSEVQGGRALAYPDASFDAAYSVSVLEHIPEQGDVLAIRELIRIVRPGGAVVVTMPYAPEYYETFVDHDVYDRWQVATEPVFFERHYDDSAVEERLLGPDSTSVIDLQLWGEGSVRVEALLDRLGPLRNLFAPFEPLLSILFLRRILPERKLRPMATFLTLEKPA